MFIHFTDQARKAMRLAEEEARRLHHEYVGTEHVLLGLVKEVAGLASKFLTNLGIELDDIREEVLSIVSFGPDQPIEDKLPLTPRAKMVLRYAMEETNDLPQTQLGTAPLLLGVLRENEGVGARILKNLGIDFELLRARIVNLQTEGMDDTISKEAFERRASAEENTVQLLHRKERTQRTKITVSVIPVRTAHVDGQSMEETAELAQRWHQEYVAKHGHKWSDDWEQQIALSLRGEDGPALLPGVNGKWFPWWKRLIEHLAADGVFQNPDDREKWQILE